MTGTYGFTANGMPHDFTSHVKHMLGEDVLVPGQAQYGGYSNLTDSYIVGRSTITGLRPVVEQAIAQVKAAQPNLSGAALEKAVANQLTQLNDWNQLTNDTQNEIQILTGINFDGMTAQEQEMTINHLLHSPLPFGDIKEVLSTTTKIDMGYTHTLDKTKTTAEYMGDNVYKVYMVSNNNNGSHTGHNLGSFMIDLTGYTAKTEQSQFASSASASSTYSGSYAAAQMVGTTGGAWFPASTSSGTVTITLGYQSAVTANGVELKSTPGYQVGHVTKVEAKDANGVWQTVWTGNAYGGVSQTLSIDFAKTAFETKEIRVSIDTNQSAGWEGIDTVKLNSVREVGTVGEAVGLEDIAAQIGNGMVQNTNNNNELYLDQAAREVLYGQIEQLDFSDIEYHNHGGAIGAGHNFYEHASSLFPDALSDNQQEFGGYSYINANTIVARSPITGLKPVIEQAIATIKAANPGLSGQALESKIANELTQLNDWEDLTEETQAELMILTGYNFDGMTAQEREMTINHLLHSPLPFGEIKEVLSTTTKIDMGYTHTLDKSKTTAEYMGDGIYKVSMISNNNNGSHTGHNLGSFMIDLTGYSSGADLSQFASTASASSVYANAAEYGYSPEAMTGPSLYDSQDPYGLNAWFPAAEQVGLVTIQLGYAAAVKAEGVMVEASGSYQAGHITKVEAMDENGVWQTVWTGDVYGGRNAKTTIEFNQTAFQTKDVRITIDTDRSTGWEGIDAVQLLGQKITTVQGEASGLENIAIQIGNKMVDNTNDNNKLYLDEAARKILYGQEDENDFTIDNPYGGGDDDGEHGGGDHGGDDHGGGDHGGDDHGGGNHGGGDNADAIMGTAGADFLEGTDGNDVIKAGDGNDVIVASDGDDQIDGGAGDYNQVDYRGSLADYTFTSNDDGTVTVAHPDYGTDTLKSIDGIWFTGEQRWYSIADAVAAGQGEGEKPAGETFTAAAEGSFLSGTAGDDTFNGGAGNDVFYGGKGDDIFNGGGGGYNQVDLDGGKADYTFTKNADGTITAASAEYGEDILKDIDGVWFYGDAEWSSTDDLAA